MKTQRLFIMLLIVIANIGYAQNLVSHDFNNGNLGPFEVCTTKSPNYSRVVNKRLKTFWTEAGYRGNRSTRGAEACGDQFFTYKEGWYGMNLEIGSDYPRNKKGGIAQIFGFIPGFWSWEAQLQIDNGDLTIVHRPNGGTRQNTEEVVVANFPYQRKVPIVIHFILSNQKKGLFEIWVNGKVEYRKRNINFGFGDFDRNDVKIGNANADRGGDSGGSLTVFKMGQYNFESNDYDNNETRTVYYDDVSWYKGANGYNIVNPGNNNPPPPTDGNTVHMRKRNASGFAIDGGNGGANGQNTYLYRSVTSNKNQQWNEINRGNGFYSYQKKGTNFCIDGGNGGANGQNVYLWTCGTNNRNQHWKKVNRGNGNFRLEKRNAPRFSLDGGRNGANRQNLKLWASNNANQNQQWTFGNARKTSNFLERNTEIHTNPTTGILNIDINEVEAANVSIYNILGQLINEQEITTGNNTIALDDLDKGVYIIKINHEGETLVKKIVND